MFLSPFDKQFLVISTATNKPSGSNSEVETEDQLNYVCNFCKSKYATESDLESHKILTHRLKVKSMIQSGKNVCRICLKRKKTKSGLIQHIKTSHLHCTSNSQRINRNIFICDSCDVMFFSKDMLVIHYVTTHRLPVEYPFHCPTCHKSISKWLYILPHLKTHNLHYASACPICLKKIDVTEKMAGHIQDQHTMLLKCDICDFVTNKTVLFETHLQMKHSQDTSFESCLEVSTDVIERCFVPRKKDVDFKYTKVTPISGLKLTGLVSICILCREICKDEAEKREHITKVHLRTPQQDRPPSSYTCTCGETFLHSVLLRHHIFKMKGDHRKIDDASGVGSTPACDAESRGVQ